MTSALQEPANTSCLVKYGIALMMYNWPY